MARYKLYLIDWLIDWLWRRLLTLIDGSHYRKTDFSSFQLRTICMWSNLLAVTRTCLDSYIRLFFGYSGVHSFIRLYVTGSKDHLQYNHNMWTYYMMPLYTIGLPISCMLTIPPYSRHHPSRQQKVCHPSRMPPPSLYAYLLAKDKGPKPRYRSATLWCICRRSPCGMRRQLHVSWQCSVVRRLLQTWPDTDVGLRLQRQWCPH